MIKREINVKRTFWKKLWRVLFRHPEWNIGIVNAPIHKFLERDYRPQVHWLPIVPNGKFFLADPFGFRHGEQLYIICEKFDYSRHRGEITGLALSPDGQVLSMKSALVSESHLAYPFIFSHQEQCYCIPETADSNEISLYRINKESPWQWNKEAVLISGLDAVDSTIFHYHGYWWLLFTRKKYGSNSTLFAWYAEELYGPWQPHKANPIKVDVTSSRPAGTPFIHHGKLYRPAQDSSRTYGGGIVINEIVKLDSEKFEERIASRIDPIVNSQHPEGIHTISSVGDITLIDAKRITFHSVSFKSALLRIVTKLLKR